MMVWLALAWGAPSPGTTELIDAFALATGQDMMEVAPADLMAAFQAACSAGATLACGQPPKLADIEAACAEGDTGACVAMGWALTQRSDKEAEQARGAAMLEQACGAGVLRACVDHATLEMLGVGMPSEPQAAAAVLRSACDRGEPRGCLRFGNAAHRGLGVPVDLAQARLRYQQSCDGGLPAGCSALGLALRLGVGGDPDPERALGLVREACLGGFGPACENLDAFYTGGLEGMGAAPRQVALEVGCSEGHAAACGHLGDLIADAEPDRALAHWRTACDAKFARGCRGVGIRLLADGNLVEGLPLVEGACEVGEPEACRVMGDRLAKGDGVPKDLAGAFAARETGCRNGSGPACVAAAKQAKKGQGTTKDRFLASEFDGMACDLGEADRCP